MPALKRVRHERFAQAIAKGMSQRAAYVAAGYSPKPTTADPEASRLTRQPKVEERVAEILKPEVRKAQVTLASILVQTAQTIEAATAAGQHGAALQGLTLQAKLLGLLRDKVEIGGPGAFDRLETMDDVMAKVRQDLGEAAYLALMASVESEPESEPKAIDNMGR